MPLYSNTLALWPVEDGHRGDLKFGPDRRGCKTPTDSLVNCLKLEDSQISHLSK